MLVLILVLLLWVALRCAGGVALSVLCVQEVASLALIVREPRARVGLDVVLVGGLALDVELVLRVECGLL